MNDKIRESVRNRRLVIWEEVARDGAQAKTILNGKQRVEIATEECKIFGSAAADHLVFAAGFPAISKTEFEAIREVSDNVTDCYISTHARAFRKEIDMSIAALKGAALGRITFFVPVNPSMCKCLLHVDIHKAASIARDIARYALDHAAGHAVDVALADIAGADPYFVADLVNVLTEEGVSVVKLCESLGKMYPLEIAEFFSVIKKNISPQSTIGTHLHNDLDLAAANTIEVLKAGTTLIATSWLGLSERSGLWPTEVALFFAAYESEKLYKRTGIDASTFFLQKPDLTRLPVIARLVSKYTGVPIKVTDKIIGSGVNSISTGTPFISKQNFEPFDPELVLGIPPVVKLTHLSNVKVLESVLGKWGLDVNEQVKDALLQEIKALPYQTGKPIFEKEEIVELIRKIEAK